MFMFFIFMFPIFILPRLLSFIMFMLAFALAVTGLVTGLGDEVGFTLALALLFEFSVLLQAAPKAAIDASIRRPIVFRM